MIKLIFLLIIFMYIYNMIYAYLNKQNSDNTTEQEYLFKQYFSHNPIGSNSIQWIDTLEQYLATGLRGDSFVIADLLSFGQTPRQILLALSQKKRVIIIKQQYEFKDDQKSYALVEALQIAAQISEKINPSPVTSSQLQGSKKSGRPKGRKSINKTLAANHEDIENALRYGVKITTLAKRFSLTRNTVRKYIDENISEELRPNNKAPKPKS